MMVSWETILKNEDIESKLKNAPKYIVTAWEEIKRYLEAQK